MINMLLGRAVGAFSGKGGATLNGTSANHTRARIGACLSGVTLDSDGNEYAIAADGTGDGDDLTPHWLINGAASDFYGFCTQNSGDALDGASATLDTWLVLSTDRSWFLNDGAGGTTETANITVKIALDSSGDRLIASKDYDLSAQNISA